jgi:hypothetical protein
MFTRPYIHPPARLAPSGLFMTCGSVDLGTGMEAPRTNYLEHDGLHIAWQVFGEGRRTS